MELRLYLFDDEAEILALLKDLFAENYEVRAFSDSRAGLENILAEESPAVLITDSRMPGLNGLQILTSIEASRPDIPVILCTGYCDDHLAQKAKERGVFSTLFKPVPFKELSQVVGAAFDKAIEHNSQRSLS